VSSSASSPAQPVISLVICTRNRCHRLPEMFSALERLTCAAAWEIVIVNNASTDDTRSVLDRYAWPAHMVVRVVDGNRVGLAAARNVGWRSARGKLIAFTDDDCYPREDFLDSVLQSFARPEVSFVGGRILLFDPTDFPVTIQTRTTPAWIAPHTFVPAGLIQGANMAVRSVGLQEVGGFDEFLGAGTPFPSEDVEILARLSAHGHGGCYDPGPVVLHHHGRKAGDDIRRLSIAYDRGRGAYYLKCFFIAEFRRSVCHEFYQSLRADLQRLRRGQSLQWQFCNEIIGAVGYAGVRVAERIRRMFS